MVNHVVIKPDHDNVNNEGRQKNQTERKEERKNHSKVSQSQIVEFGHVVDVLVNAEVHAVLFDKK